MVTRLLAAAVAGGVTFFVLGFVIYGLILENAVMKPNMNTYAGLMNEVPVWVPLVLANLVSALLLAYIFEQWAGIRTFVGGMKGGAIVMFLISLSFQLMFLAFMNLHKNYIPPIADVLGSIVMGAIGGGVIGAVLGMMNKEA
ncbi:MAG: hypothetical protein WBC19_14105 [Pyrinomonadaceae bacterium]|nr:hypothetical protein [Pyrinomonadaceae bacterium]